MALTIIRDAVVVMEEVQSKPRTFIRAGSQVLEIRGGRMKRMEDFPPRIRKAMTQGGGA